MTAAPRQLFGDLNLSSVNAVCFYKFTLLLFVLSFALNHHSNSHNTYSTVNQFPVLPVCVRHPSTTQARYPQSLLRHNLQVTRVPLPRRPPCQSSRCIPRVCHDRNTRSRSVYQPATRWTRKVQNKRSTTVVASFWGKLIYLHQLETHMINVRFFYSSNMGSSNDSGYVPYQSPRKARLRQRNLEVVMSGRHKFEIRDLEDSLSDESVVPLALPKLPSAFQQSSSASQIPLTGLVRVSQVDARLNAQAPHQLENNPGIGSVSYRQPILNESIEEEKLHIDNSTSEKMQKRSSTQSKNSSPSSSRASWCNAGESMAHKAECSSISSNEIDNKFARSTMICSTVETEEDFSSITFTNDYQICKHFRRDYYILSSLITYFPAASETMPTLTLSRTVGMSIEPEELEKDHVHEIDNINKFCDLADKVGDALLDDETSPTNSMMSSYTDSDGKKKLNGHVPSGGDKIVEEANEKSKSPPTPGTPSHTNSNSMSLSDPGRDFLIDDEIADQPELVSNYKNGM